MRHTNRFDLDLKFGQEKENELQIAIEGKATFIQAGGQEFHYIPCLNERDDWIHALTDIALTNLEGWIGLEDSKENTEQSRKLAIEMGAKN